MGWVVGPCLSTRPFLLRLHALILGGRKEGREEGRKKGRMGERKNGRTVRSIVGIVGINIT
jgi:hypothetical protein